MTWQSKISKKSALNSDSHPVRRSMFKPRGFSPRTDESDGISPVTGKYAMPDYSKVDFSPRTQPLLQPKWDFASPIQPKLTVGAPGDKYEQEADSMASQVMSMPDSAVQREMTPEETEEEVQAKPLAAGITPLVQRETMPEEEEVQTKALGNATIQREAIPEEEEIQTKPISASIQREISPEEEEVQTKPSLQCATDGSFQAGGNIESQLGNSKGGGSPLGDEVRSFMEPRFGADFSSVRVHTGDEAVQMNRELGAQAFTHGSDVYFGAGKVPGNNELTAHELTHVVQQTGQVQTKKTSKTIVPRKLRFITMKRKHIELSGSDKYGHWWTEIDGKESYGWWPKYQVGFKGTMLGVEGELNGMTSFGGTRTQDPHHGDSAPDTFHPVLKDPTKTNAQVEAEIRTFASSYSGEWRWTFGFGQNCHTFQESLMDNVGLEEP